ncbi:PP2C family protein-serine/threonine phosphatase [Actinomadura rudentiformis]|uniref:Serine/threonine-protein phosphatase n=1 Tax=Actinomadura rudentiformis TaxID=359158 RepID=A0A6H9YTU8_9ACTN|nr:PP2C family protein-serine/threonine phosphatase [Actinomadura rudentiformis]KAB2346924.1 serine/threonine-protein phosphatase [Actinomadura rudentiformis]
MIAIADAALGAAVVFIGLLIAGPMLASARCTGLWTALAGCYAVVLAVAVGVPDEFFGTADHLTRCLIVAVGASFAALAARIRTDRERALTRMTQVAQVAQQALLRPIPAEVGQMSFAHRYRSATREAQIGGDLYDVALTPYGLRLIIGDVKGKGLPAIQQAASVLRCFRETVFATASLTGLAKELNARISPELAAEDFVTVLLAEFAPGQVRLVNCGHPPPLRIGPGSQMLHPPQPTPPLGLNPEPMLQHVRLDPDQRLLFYTDGLIEAKDSHSTMFTLNHQAIAVLNEPLLEAALEGLLDLVLNHVCGQFEDDLALVLCQPTLTSHIEQPGQSRLPGLP